MNAAALQTLAAAINNAPKGTRIKILGYKTESGRVCDYEIVIGTYADLERDALKGAHQLRTADVVLHTGAPRSVAMTVLNGFRSAMTERVQRLDRGAGPVPTLVDGRLFGQIVSRSAASSSRRVVSPGSGAAVRAWLDSTFRLDAFRSFYLDRAELVLIDGQELCGECGDGMDRHNDGECPSPTASTFDPYAYGYAKESYLERG